MSWVIWRAATGSAAGVVCLLPALFRTRWARRCCSKPSLYFCVTVDLINRLGSLPRTHNSFSMQQQQQQQQQNSKWNKNILIVRTYIYYKPPFSFLCSPFLFLLFLPFHPVLCAHILLYFLFKPYARTRPYSCLVRITIGSRDPSFYFFGRRFVLATKGQNV